MCGRFALVTNVEKIRYQFTGVEDLLSIDSHYNIPPGQSIAMLYQTPDLKLALTQTFWGLIPFWDKTIKLSHGISNARSETVAEKQAFKRAYQKRRGLVLMSGFYEWQPDNGGKQPWYFKRDDDLLIIIAAIWEERATEEGGILKTSALLTTDANELMQPIHDRMPVIISEENQADWLDNREYHPDFLASLLRPEKSPHLICYPVTRKMNNARFDEQEAILPL